MALLKCRWRRLKYFDASGMKSLCESVVACCVLRNLCLLKQDSAEDWLFPHNEAMQEEEAEANAENTHAINAAEVKGDNIPGHLLGLSPQ